MSGLRNRTSRQGGIRWMDELDTDTDPFSTPPAWQTSEPPMWDSWSRREMECELRFNERLQFEPQMNTRLDTATIASPLQDWWNDGLLDSELPGNEQHDSGPSVDEVLETYVTSPPNQDLSFEAGPSENARVVEQKSALTDQLSKKWQKHGYMDQPSHFLFDTPPTESSFLESYPKGNATLTYQNDENILESIHNVNISIVEDRCPILAMAFEESRSGPRLYLETLTSATALPFLRYLYTGSYALKGASGNVEDFYEDVPTSVLFHCQLYRLANIHELPDLKSQAYVNVLRQCEFGCSSPDKPIELCAAVRFIYQHLREHENLIDAIINYCVSCFLQHRLSEDEQFKKLAYELRPFHQALCRNSMNREFENETAGAIVQMPFKPYIPETYASRDDPATAQFDDVFHFHSNDDIDNSPKKRKRLEGLAKDDDQITIPLRPRQECIDLKEDERGLQDEDYKFGSKRRASSVAGPSAPTRSGLTQLLSTQDPGALSDTEYEIVEGPGPVEEASDSDSDSSTLVSVKHEELDLHTLPLRTRAGPARVVTASESDSESEWTLV